MLLASLKHVRPSGLLDQSLLARSEGQDQDEADSEQQAEPISYSPSPLIQIEG